MLQLDQEEINKINDLAQKAYPFSQFLQSYPWAQFQEALGKKVFFIRALKEIELAVSALIIKQPLPLNKSYFYCPRGPVWEGDKIKDPLIFFKNFLDKVKNIALKEKALFFRFEPLIDIDASQFSLISSSSVQPRYTLLLDISLSEEELLKNMHPKTRYNIRLAQRKGIKVRESKDPLKDIEIFLKLLDITARREKFKPHPHYYYRTLIKILSPFVSLFLAEYQDKVLVANLVYFFGNTATYLHGASSGEYRNLMAPHYLQWFQIKTAKEKGYKYYDLWGIAPPDVSNHPWRGITRFKKGFGGRIISFPPCYDLVIDPFWYKIYKTAKKITRL